MADERTSIAIARIEFLEAARSSENELLAQRATWLVLTQSFLFATFAIVDGQVEQGQDSQSIPWLLFHIIPIVGLSIAILVQLAVGAAVYMLWSLHRQLVALQESPEVVSVHWPKARRPVPAMILGQLPSIVAPVGLAIVWAVLLAQPGPSASDTMRGSSRSDLIDDAAASNQLRLEDLRPRASGGVDATLRDHGAARRDDSREQGQPRR